MINLYEWMLLHPVEIDPQAADHQSDAHPTEPPKLIFTEKHFWKIKKQNKTKRKQTHTQKKKKKKQNVVWC